MIFKFGRKNKFLSKIICQNHTSVRKTINSQEIKLQIEVFKILHDFWNILYEFSVFSTRNFLYSLLGNFRILYKEFLYSLLGNFCILYKEYSVFSTRNFHFFNVGYTSKIVTWSLILYVRRVQNVTLVLT